MGIVGLSVRFLGILLLALAVSAGWFFRDRLLGSWNAHRAAVAPAEPSVGRPGTGALVQAREKVDSLNGWHADSVVLSPSELASLLGEGLEPEFRRYVDSLTVELGDGDLSLSGVLLTSAIPSGLLGPLASVFGPRERLAARGTVAVTGPGQAECRVRELVVRGIPLPSTVTAEVVERGLHGSKEGALPFRIPAGIGGVRVRPDGVTLYRLASAR